MMVNGLACCQRRHRKPRPLRSASPYLCWSRGGFPLEGDLREGVTATGSGATITQMLRSRGWWASLSSSTVQGFARSQSRRPRHHREHGPPEY